MIPPGHGLPGGLEAGVHRYLERALEPAPFSGVRRLFRQGAEALDALARARFGTGLEALPPETRLNLLAAMGQQLPDRFPWTALREALLDFVLEGYQGHPWWGGNRAGAVWEALEVPLPAAWPGEE